MEFEIKVNDILTFRDGTQAMVYKSNNDLIWVQGAYWGYIESFNDNLTLNDVSEGNHDIIKIQRPAYPHQLTESYRCQSHVVWSRKEKPLFHGMTYEEAHRKMWKWLAENPDKTKKEWFAFNNYEIVVSFCFSCKCCNVKCDRCPLDRHIIGCKDGLYNRYDVARLKGNYKLASQYANIIAQLPWREVE